MGRRRWRASSHADCAEELEVAHEIKEAHGDIIRRKEETQIQYDQEHAQDRKQRGLLALDARQAEVSLDVEVVVALRAVVTDVP
jgi:hypothetical protein